MGKLADRLKQAAGALERIAGALDRIAPPTPSAPNFQEADAFVWHPDGVFQPVAQVNRVPLNLLQAIGRQRDSLVANTERFARGLPANNALLWGARGMGKSSLVKAVHAAVRRDLADAGLKLIEIHREDIATLPQCLAHLSGAPHRFILFCDDLSFESEDTSYKSLKALLEGGIEGRPGNVLFYATSNRRHLMPRSMMDNESATAIHPGEAVEEKVSLSDRFGLWIGFHACTQDDYLAMVQGYAEYFGLTLPGADIESQALQWAQARGSRSGRVAWQFIQDLAGRMGARLDRE